MLDHLEAVPQDQPHRQPRVVVGPDVGELGERRSEHEAGGRCPRLEGGDHPGSQRLPEVDRPFRCVAELRQRFHARDSVGDEPLLARRAGVAPVTAVVHEQHCEATSAQLSRQTGPTGAIAAVAGCHQDGEVELLVPAGGHEPGAELEAVRRVQGDVTSPVDHPAGRRNG